MGNIDEAIGRGHEEEKDPDADKPKSNLPEEKSPEKPTKTIIKKAGASKQEEEFKKANRSR